MNNFLPKNYKFIKKIGSGDFGNVYLAEKNSNLYAIKIFKDSFSNDYKKELENLNKLNNHCDIFVCVKDHGIDKNQKYIVMEYKNGNRLNFAKITNKNIENILKKLLIGLDTLFKLGISHQDIKPDNIIFNTETNEVNIIDFGLSCIHETCDNFKESIFYPPLPIDYNIPINTLQNLDIYALGMTIKEALNIKNKEECLKKYNQNISNYLDLINKDLEKCRKIFNNLLTN